MRLGVQLGQRSEDELAVERRPPARIGDQFCTRPMVVIQDRGREHFRLRGVSASTEDDLERAADLPAIQRSVAVEVARDSIARGAAKDRFAEMQDGGDCKSHVSVANGVETIADFWSAGRHNLSPTSGQRGLKRARMNTPSVPSCHLLL